MKLSFVLPVLNEQDLIGPSLSRLQSYRRRGHEVIVVDGGSDDGTVARAESADRVLCSLPGRSRQMNRGAAAATGDWLVFLHADTVLPERVDKLIGETSGAGAHRWLWFDARFAGKSPPLKVIAWFMNRRARLSRVCTGDQTLVVARDLFQALGGFPDIPLMEDIAMSKRLRREGEPAVIGAAVTVSSRRWERHGILSTVLLMWRLRLLYFLGVDAERLADLYYPERKTRQARGWHYPHGRLLVFAREPVLGKVKKRLAGSIGEEAAFGLYRAMLGHIVQLADDMAIAPVSLWVTANPAHEYFLGLCRPGSIHLQGEGDLGRRMERASAGELARGDVESVVLVGSDCPAIDGLYLMQAFHALQQGDDLVLGPAEDGGYVLIGLRGPVPELFADMPWGSAAVLGLTLARANDLGLKYSLLRTLSDVDRAEDLVRLRRQSAKWQSLLRELDI